MTAPPSIPNLFSLRGSRGGDGFRQRRGGAGGGVVTQSAAGHDATIQGTDTDAAVSRSSAVGLGYLHDPFAQYFVQNAFGPSSRRLPIINRGTYTRTAGLDVLVDRFLGLVDGDNNQRQGQKSQQKQIISLGAGTDTRSLRLLDKHSSAGIVYHEIDFPLICAKKLNIVKATPALRTLLTDPQVEDDGSWRCSTPNDGRFWCHGLDLRRLISQQSDASADIKGLRTDVPTLLISECCLCYLQVPEAKSVIKWFSDRIPNLGIVIYEPTKPDDPFGKTMVSNLAARGISMPTLSSYRQPADQETRLRDAGFDIARHMTVDDIWSKWVAPEEKERVDRLEGLDEVEEWELLAGHYVVAWAWRGLGFEPWGQLR